MKSYLQSAFPFLLLIAFAVVSQPASAQTGSVVGTVYSADGRQPLPGANIIVNGNGIGTASDRHGKYLLSKVPGGTQKITVTYIGFDTKTVEVKAGSRTVLDIELKDSFYKMEGITVEGLRGGEARALNQQKTADNIMNVVSSDKIGDFPDPNVAEALQRVPAISVQRDQGEGRYVLIRGTEARLNAVTINGDRIPSPEGDIRSVALDVIPADILASIEVNKALTPDMDADAIGGSINIVTKTALTKERTLKATIASGYSNISSNVNYQGSLAYGNRLGDEGQFGYMISGSYFNNNMGSDNNEMEYNTADFGNGDQYVIEELQLRDYTINRERYGVAANFDYKFNPQSSVYLRTMFNRFGDHEYRRRNILKTDADDYSSLTTAAGEAERELKDRLEVQQIVNASFGGEHALGSMILDYHLSASYSEESEPEARYATFKNEDLEFTIDRSTENFPQFSITNDKSFTDPTQFEFDEFSVEDNLTLDREFAGAANLKIPFNLGPGVSSVKVGAKYRMKNKYRDMNIKVYDGFSDDPTLADMLERFDTGEFVNGEYDVDKYGPGINVNADQLKEILENRTADLELDADGTLEDSNANDYSATEDVMAAYAMATLNLGDLMILPGVRFEGTNLEYTSNEVLFNVDGDLESVTTGITNTKDYANILPMLHVRYRLNPQTNLRVAYTNTLARPNYFDLAPYRLVNREDNELAIGNPDLDPTLASNIDFMAEHYLPSIGIVSAGFFYKDLKDYIYLFTEQNIDFQGESFERTQPQNGESASLYGFEVAWQQQLSFLPGVLDGLGIYANYTYTHSEAVFPWREEGQDKATLPGQAEHMMNVSLSYEKYGFSGRISVNMHGKYLDEVGEIAEEDRYYDNRLQLDVTMSQRITSNIRVFADFLNLTNAPLRYYQYETSRPMQQEFYSWSSHFGFKFDL